MAQNVYKDILSNECLVSKIFVVEEIDNCQSQPKILVQSEVNEMKKLFISRISQKLIFRRLFPTN